ncbi:hypothetical protein HK102_001348, partial [Quaeritorhiza haematococci]
GREEGDVDGGVAGEDKTANTGVMESEKDVEVVEGFVEGVEGVEKVIEYDYDDVDDDGEDDDGDDDDDDDDDFDEDDDERGDCRKFGGRTPHTRIRNMLARLKPEAESPRGTTRYYPYSASVSSNLKESTTTTTNRRQLTSITGSTLSAANSEHVEYIVQRQQQQQVQNQKRQQPLVATTTDVTGNAVVSSSSSGSSSAAASSLFGDVASSRHSGTSGWLPPALPSLFWEEGRRGVN